MREIKEIFILVIIAANEKINSHTILYTNGYAPRGLLMHFFEKEGWESRSSTFNFSFNKKKKLARGGG